MQLKRDFEKVFLDQINKEEHNISLIGLSGSDNLENDLDIYSILSNDYHTHYSEIFSRHNALLKIFRGTKKILKEDLNYDINIFTEFRNEEFCRFFAPNGNHLIHLKTYPSPKHVFYWQQKVVAKSYFQSTYKILHTDGTIDFDKFIKSLPKPKLQESIEFLKMLCFETIELTELSSLEIGFLELEKNKKAKYVIKYLYDYISDLIQKNNNSNLMDAYKKLDKIKSSNELDLFKILEALHKIEEHEMEFIR